MTEPKTIRRLGVLLGLGALATLVLLSVFLAWNRIIQVDEAQNVMMARIIAFNRSAEFMASAPLMLLGPVTWMAKAASSSSDLFHQTRLLFVGLMWLNCVLMVKASGARLRSGEGLILLLLGATLEPLWDYGFEIRHDNLLLTGALILWLLLRSVSKPVPHAHLLAGVVAVLMQLVAFKAFLYSVPVLGFFLLLLAIDGQPGSRWRPAARAMTGMVAGVVLGLVVGWSLHQLAGTWPLFAESFRGSASASASAVVRFPPWPTVDRLVEQVPLLVAGSLAILVVPLHRLCGRVRDYMFQLLREPFVPELAFLLICVAAFFANPTPFPYNLLLLVPAQFIAVARHRALLVKGIGESGQAWLLWPLLAAVHLVPWATSTPRHFDMTNERQLQLVTLAENLTDPRRHRVFDGAGLVPTRDPIGFYWLIHTFTVRPLMDGTWPSIRSQLDANEVPVILSSYRTNWITVPDRRFIEAHYLPLTQDFQLVGTRLEKGEGRWTALASGIYFFSVEGAGASEAWVEVDGQRVRPGSHHLARGPHQFRFPAESTLTAIWCGAQCTAPPRLDDTSRPLFVNWY